jgi:hypothetical protein
LQEPVTRVKIHFDSQNRKKGKADAPIIQAIALRFPVASGSGIAFARAIPSSLRFDDSATLPGGAADLIGRVLRQKRRSNSVSR